MVVKCPNCNQYVSDTASVYPNCEAKETLKWVVSRIRWNE